MTDLLSVKVKGDKKAIKRFNALPAQIDKASIRSIRKVTNWARGQLASHIAKANLIPVRALKSKKARRSFSTSPRRGVPVGVVWLGTNPVKAAYVGKPRDAKGGAKSGKHYWEGAFAETMNTGHRSVWRRVGEERLPIFEETVELNEQESLLREVSSLSYKHYEKVLLQEINYEVNVKGR